MMRAMRVEHDMLRRLCRARELLCDVDAERATPLAEVARVAAMSPFHFIRRFEALFGATPHQLRLQARIERAKRLLAAGERSVTEVCMEVGFSSLGSFSALFKRRVGMAPSAYRQEMRRLVVQVPDGWRRALEPGCLTLMAGLPVQAFRNFREA
jgi:AraC-like DNA-binding protein